MRKVSQVVWNENTTTGRFRRQKRLPNLFGCCFSIHFLFFACLLNAYASWVLSFPSFLTWYPAWLCSHSHCANPSQPSLLSFKHGTLPFGYLIGISSYHPNFVKVAHSCLTLCDSMDYTVHGILQARIPEWVVMLFSRVSSQPRDWTQVSPVASRFFTSRTIREEALTEYWQTAYCLSQTAYW